MGAIVRAVQQAPPDGPCLFLAGGISGCPAWQAPLATELARRLPPWILLDPRREVPPEQEEEVAAQIEWEHRHLRRAEAVLFWFPAETLCPITLYELGAMSMTDKRLFVGVHPGYQRRKDVIHQTRLVRPEVNVVHDLDALATEVVRGLAS